MEALDIKQLHIECLSLQKIQE